MSNGYEGPITAREGREYIAALMDRVESLSRESIEANRGGDLDKAIRKLDDALSLRRIAMRVEGRIEQGALSDQ